MRTGVRVDSMIANSSVFSDGDLNLEAQIAELEAEIVQLQKRIAELEAARQSCPRCHDDKR
jgi:uncharacterized protein YceH (UPF0502 family)